MARLGDGTEESHRRAQTALDRLWPYTGELFAADAEMIAAGVAIDPESLRGVWDRAVDAMCARATLSRPKDGWMQSGGREGRHSEHLGYLLAELQFLPRSHPGAVW